MALSSHLALLLLSFFTLSDAKAARIFSLNEESCSTGCSVLPAGTITLTQIATDQVSVELQLGPDYSIRDSSNNHNSFTFNISGVSNFAVSGITSGDTDVKTFGFDSAGPYSQAGFGSFQYRIDCRDCPNNNSQITRRLSFTATGTGLTITSFSANTSGYYFSADIGGKTQAAGIGLTGVAATKTFTDSAVPEPTSMLMLFSAFGGLILLRRKQNRKLVS